MKSVGLVRSCTFSIWAVSMSGSRDESRRKSRIKMCKKYHKCGRVVRGWGPLKRRRKRGLLLTAVVSRRQWGQEQGRRTTYAADDAETREGKEKKKNPAGEAEDMAEGMGRGKGEGTSYRRRAGGERPRKASSPTGGRDHLVGWRRRECDRNPKETKYIRGGARAWAPGGPTARMHARVGHGTWTRPGYGPSQCAQRGRVARGTAVGWPRSPRSPSRPHCAPRSSSPWLHRARRGLQASAVHILRLH